MKAIQLTKGYVAYVDDCDFERVSKYLWIAKEDRNTVYAHRVYWVGNGYKTVSMHRFILGEPEENVVDHINGYGLNNTRSNLRLATKSQNQHNRRISKNNTSGYKGVDWVKARSKWRAQIRLNNERIYLGTYENILDAAKAYNEAATKYFGEFAKLNSIEEETD